MIPQLLVSGIALGVVYGLIAMGMVLIFRAVGVVNFAQGDFLMLGGFVAFVLNQQAGLPIGVCFGITALIMGVCGVLFQFAAYWPLRKAKDKTIVVSTLGAAIVLREACRLIWGATPKTVDAFVDGAVKVGSAVLQWQYIVIIAVAACLMLLIYLLLEKTFIGNILQATAQDQRTASLMGISVVTAISVTFAISIMITGLGGLLLAPLFVVTTTMGVTTGVKAFTAVIIGGFGSVPGAIIGGLIVGLTETFAGGYISTTYKDALVFVVLIFVLIVRPQGLFGEKISEKV